MTANPYAALEAKGLRIGQPVSVGKAHSVWAVENNYAGDDSVWLSRQTIGGKVTSKRAKLADIRVIANREQEFEAQVWDGRGWVFNATAERITLTEVAENADIAAETERRYALYRADEEFNETHGLVE